MEEAQALLHQPVKVLQCISEATYKLELPQHCRLAPAFNVSQLKPVTPGPLAENAQLAPLPAPPDIEGQPAYIVKKITNSCHIYGKIQYLIEWDRNSPEER